MNKRQMIRGVIAMACVASLICAPVAPVQAQQTPSGSASTPSPGGGITNGLNPIETTLFAYRSLASDVEAVSSEVAAVANGKKVVIGTAQDVAAFTQWRAIMGQARLLYKRAKDISFDINYAQYTDAVPLPPPQLSVALSHVTNNGLAVYTILVTNSASASPTFGTVTVTDILSAGWTMSQIGGAGWACSKDTFTCTRSDVLLPGFSYPPIYVTATPPASKASNTGNAAPCTGGTNPCAPCTPPPATPCPPCTPPPATPCPPCTTPPAKGAAPCAPCSQCTTPPAKGSAAPRRSTPPPLFNSVTVTGGGSATQTTTDPQPASSATLRITETHQGDMTPGGTVTYTVTVRNTSTVAANAPMIVTDQPSSGLTITNLSGDGWTCNADTKTCTRATPLAPRESASFKVTATVGTTPGTVSNSVTLSGGASAPITVTDPPPAPPPMLSASQSYTVTGDRVTLTIRVVNNSASPTTAPIIILDRPFTGLELLELTGLFYVGPTQINAMIPADAVGGAATITVYTARGMQYGSMTLTSVAPGLFSANGNGQGVAAAQFVAYPYVGVMDVFQCTNGSGTCVPVPIAVSASGKGELVLYGTGIRNAASPVMVNVGSLTLTADYAGAVAGDAGEDQVNVALPASLHSGLTPVTVSVTVPGTTTVQTSNIVTIYIE